VHAVLRAHDHLAKALERNGIANIRHRLPERERIAGILDQASGGSHQVGTARMSESANHGVVNRNCRVHGSPNLFLAGSAVFPSSGQANPTLLAVALASRLASHLGREFQQLPTC
jgi:choline dehydrogenase-like flavoprotein